MFYYIKKRYYYQHVHHKIIGLNQIVLDKVKNLIKSSTIIFNSNLTKHDYSLFNLKKIIL